MRPEQQGSARIARAPLSAPGWLAPSLFGLLSACYFFQAFSLAANAPLWMDEVLAVWTARLPSFGAIWQALENGAEFTPPLYDSLLHMMMGMGLTSPIMIRLPSIMAGYLAALAMGVLVRRRLGTTLAAVAAGVVLSGGMFEFAVQARPYACVIAAFGWTLVLWDRLPSNGPASLRLLLPMALLLIAMVALHFYAVLLVMTLGLMEVVWRGMEGRAPRLSVIICIGVAGASIFLWLPIMEAASAFSSQDVIAPDYYGRPRWIVLLATYVLLGGSTGLAMAACCLVLIVTRGSHLSGRRDIAVALLLLSIPILIFAFAHVGTHSFAPRYAVAGTFGFALLTVCMIRQAGDRAHFLAAAILAILLMLSMFDRYGGELEKPDRLDALALANAAPGDLPIATGSGLRFFELLANLPPSVARRVIYLDLPDVPPPDPTNRHQVERWSKIDRRLPVVDAQSFICATPRFLLLTEPGDGSDIMPAWLAARASFKEPSLNKPSLILIQSLPCGAGGKASH